MLISLLLFQFNNIAHIAWGVLEFSCLSHSNTMQRFVYLWLLDRGLHFRYRSRYHDVRHTIFEALVFHVDRNLIHTNFQFRLLRNTNNQNKEKIYQNAVTYFHCNFFHFSTIGFGPVPRKQPRIHQVHWIDL